MRLMRFSVRLLVISVALAAQVCTASDPAEQKDEKSAEQIQREKFRSEIERFTRALSQRPGRATGLQPLSRFANPYAATGEPSLGVYGGFGRAKKPSGGLPGEIIWTDDSIDPGISVAIPEWAGEFQNRAWGSREINGLMFYILPVAETNVAPAARFVTAPLVR